MDSKIPYILSLAYKDHIDEVCQRLSQLGLKYFVMYIIFNDGSRFALSNLYHLLLPYYGEGYYKEDYSYQPEITHGIEYYLCDRTPAVSENFKNALEQQFNIYRAYNIVRRCPECTFIFSAVKDKAFDKVEEFYRSSVKNFENFCIEFVNRFVRVIKQYHPQYNRSLILNNVCLRIATIKGTYPQYEQLTEREKDCLDLAALGKSVKEVAKILSISPFTVEQHYKNIRNKFNCCSMIEAVVEGIYKGIIGNIPIVDRSQNANLPIMQTNLELLNDV